MGKDASRLCMPAQMHGSVARNAKVGPLHLTLSGEGWGAARWLEFANNRTAVGVVVQGCRAEAGDELRLLPRKQAREHGT